MQPVSTEPAVCPVCGPALSRMSFSAVDRLHGFEGHYAYHRCSNCGLLFMNLRVRRDAAMHVYPQSCAPHAGSALGSNPKSLTKRDLRWLRGIGVRRSVKASLGPASRVLDVGCAPAIFSQRSSAKPAAPSPGSTCQKQPQRARVNAWASTSSAERSPTLPGPPGSFDLVTAWWSLSKSALLLVRHDSRHAG